MKTYRVIEKVFKSKLEIINRGYVQASNKEEAIQIIVDKYYPLKDDSDKKMKINRMFFKSCLSVEEYYGYSSSNNGNLIKESLNEYNMFGFNQNGNYDVTQDIID